MAALATSIIAQMRWLSGWISYQSPVGQPLVASTGVHLRSTSPDEVFSIEKIAPLGSALASTLYEFAVLSTPDA